MKIFGGIDRAIGSLKQATGNPLRAGYNVYPWGIRDYSYKDNAQDAYMATAAVFTVVTCYGFHVPQLRFVVRKGLAPGGELWPDHPLQYILDQPNDDMDQASVQLYGAIYKLLGGASYLYAYRNSRPTRGTDGIQRSGQITGFRPHSPAELAPVPVAGSGQQITRQSWIERYNYIPLSGGTPETVAREDVIMLRFPSVNPINPYVPVSPIAAAFIDINTDKEVSNYPLTLLKNSAFMSLIFSMPPESKDWPDSAFMKVKASIDEAYTGADKFKPGVVRGGVSAQSYLPDFRKLEFTKLGDRPEIRICTSTRVPVMYAGFSAGLQTSTYDNIALSRLGFVKDTIIPLALLDAAALTNAMRRENWAGHPMGNGTSEFTIDVDTSNLQALKEESVKMWTDATALYNAGGLTFNEYRTMIGKPPIGPEGDQYKDTTNGQAALS